MHGLQHKLGTQRQLHSVRVHKRRVLLHGRECEPNMLGLRDCRPWPARVDAMHVDVQRSCCELRGRHVFRHWHTDECVHIMLGTFLRCRHLPAGLHVYDQCGLRQLPCRIIH